MGISLKKEHLKRYKDVAALLLKYGNSELVKSAGLEGLVQNDDEKRIPISVLDPLAGPKKAAVDASVFAENGVAADEKIVCVGTKPEGEARPIRLPQGGYGYVTKKTEEEKKGSAQPEQVIEKMKKVADDVSAKVSETAEKFGGSNGNGLEIVNDNGEVVVYKDGAFSDLAKRAEEEGKLAPAQANTTPEDFARDLEKLGPTFIKLGQLLSTRADFLPAAYMQALTRLQDNCEPFSYSDVEHIVGSELGVRMSKAFLSFDSEPIAAASIGQIHHAVLRDGREVAVKVQRPGIREVIVNDIEALFDIAEFYDKHTKTGKKYQFMDILEEFRKSIMDELDYRKESANLERLRDNLHEFELIKVPCPISYYSTSKVLTMDFIKGKKITAISNLERLDLDGAPLAESIFKAYLKQILIDGFFHADPHPGNVLLTDDNKIALIDLGMVARLTQHMQGKLFLMLLAISEQRADAVANIAIDIGEQRDNFDEQQFRSRVTSLVQGHIFNNLTDMELGVVIVGITQISSDCGIKVPAELTMLGKTLLNLDQVGSTLDPNFSPNESMRRNAPMLMRKRMESSLSVGHIFTSLVEAKDFIEKMPGTVHKIMDLVATNSLRMKVDAIDEAVLVDSAQKIANRVTLGLILAALIMGASNLMKVPTSFTLFGYPGIAMICFLLAASAGFALAIHIAIYDQHGKTSKQ